jgi:hypothetical protein
MKKAVKLLVLLALIPSVTACANQSQAAENSHSKVEVVKDYSYQKKTKKLVAKNKRLKKSIESLQNQISDDQKFIDEHNNKATQSTSNTSDLANLDYTGNARNYRQWKQA